MRWALRNVCWTEHNYMHWFWYGDSRERYILQEEIEVFLNTACMNITELHE